MSSQLHPGNHTPVAHAPGASQQPQEKEKIAYGTIMVVSVVSLIIFVIGGYWALGIQRSTEREVIPDGAKPVPAQAGQVEIGLVNMALFTQDKRAQDRAAEQRNQLTRFGYVDAQKQTMHIPIEEAIKQALKESSASSGKRSEP